MDKIYIIYWSQTGNTQVMAEAIGKGVEDSGKQAEVVYVGNASVNDLMKADVFALGCPAMGAEVLEETEMEPFVSDLENYVAGKKIALFGSYGWGDGQWMRDWEERMISAGATILGNEGVICREMPDEEALSACEEIGKMLASV